MNARDEIRNEVAEYVPLRYPCKRCGDGTKVTIAEAPAHGDRFHPSKWDMARIAARKAAAARMADPEFQAKLQAARAEAAACVKCGNNRVYHADTAVDHAYVPRSAATED